MHTTWQSSNCQLFKNNCSDITWERRTSPFYLSPSPKSPIKSSWECCKGSGNISLEIKIEDCTGEEPVIRESTSMLQFWVHKLPGLQKENKFPPKKNALLQYLFALWSWGLHWNLEATSKVARWWDGTVLFCNTVRAWIPKLGSKVCGCGKGGQTDVYKNRLLCSKQAEKHQPCCSPPPFIASSLTLCLFSSAIPLPTTLCEFSARGCACHFLGGCDLCSKQVLRKRY